MKPSKKNPARGKTKNTSPGKDGEQIQPVAVINTAKNISPSSVADNVLTRRVVQLHNAATGRTVAIGHKTAKRLAEKYPAEYSIQ